MAAKPRRKQQRPATRPRVYLDENVGPAAMQVLVNAGVHLQTAQQAGLLGHDDEDHYSHCWNMDQILVTHDWDFWNQKKLKDHRNPGVAILDCDERDTQGAQATVRHFLRFCALTGHSWRRSRVAFGTDGTVIVMRRDKSGVMSPQKFTVTEDEVKPFVPPRRKRRR